MGVQPHLQAPTSAKFSPNTASIQKRPEVTRAGGLLVLLLTRAPGARGTNAAAIDKTQPAVFFLEILVSRRLTWLWS